MPSPGMLNPEHPCIGEVSFVHVVRSSTVFRVIKRARRAWQVSEEMGGPMLVVVETDGRFLG